MGKSSIEQSGYHSCNKNMKVICKFSQKLLPAYIDWLAKDSAFTLGQLKLITYPFHSPICGFDSKFWLAMTFKKHIVCVGG